MGDTDRLTLVRLEPITAESTVGIIAPPPQRWANVPRVGDLIVVYDGTYTVRTVFWHYPSGDVTVRFR